MYLPLNSYNKSSQTFYLSNFQIYANRYLYDLFRLENNSPSPQYHYSDWGLFNLLKTNLNLLK